MTDFDDLYDARVLESIAFGNIAGIAPNTGADLSAALQAVLDAKKALFLQPGTYLASGLVQRRGSAIIGIGSTDTDITTGVCIKRPDGANEPILTLPYGSDGVTVTHYMWLENLWFDGNGANQTVEAATIDFRGAFVHSGLRRVRIANSFGPAIVFGNGCDVRVDGLWVFKACTSTYAVAVNESLTGTDAAGLIDWGEIYVENVTRPQAGAYWNDITELRADPSKRGKAILLNRVVRIGIHTLHVEGASVAMDIEKCRVVSVGVASGAHVGDGSANTPIENAFYRIRDADATVALGPLHAYNTATGFRMVAALAGVNVTQTPQDAQIMGGYQHSPHSFYANV